jgi:hypothetical protein
VIGFAALVAAALALVPAAPALELPSDWQLERPPPYPNLVAAFRHRRDATLTVGVQYVGPGEDGESLARGNAQALLRMGFDVRREGATLSASRSRSPIAVRQVYVVRGTVGWVITLAGTASDLELLARDLSAAARQAAEPGPAGAESER